MFGNLGMGEIIVIAGIALIILGPEKFPEYAKIAMRAWRDLRGYVDDIKREMAEELKPVKKEIQQLGQYDPEQYIDKLTEAVTSVNEEVSGAVTTAADTVGEAVNAEPNAVTASAEPAHDEPAAGPAAEHAGEGSGVAEAVGAPAAEGVAADKAPAQVDG